MTQQQAVESSVISRDRSVRVQDASGSRLEPTSEKRADELVTAGKAYWIRDEGTGKRHLRLRYVLSGVAAMREATAVLTGTRAQVRRYRIAQLRERDGDCCFYCLKPMPEGQMTLEHLLARHCNGHNGLSNLVLAHRHCNEQAGHLSMMEKIRMRERILAARLIADQPARLGPLLQALYLLPRTLGDT